MILIVKKTSCLHIEMKQNSDEMLYMKTQNAMSYDYD